MSKYSNVKKALDRAYLPDPYDYYSARLEGVKGRADGKQCKSLCPFHGENTPSFTWQNATGTFKCFGCGVSGDIVSFHMQLNGYSFVEACKELGAWR